MTMTSNYIERRRSGKIMRYGGNEYNLDDGDFYVYQAGEWPEAFADTRIADEQIASLNRMIDNMRRRAVEHDTEKVCEHGLPPHLCMVCGGRQSDTGELA